jgi:glycosyltransferase involved in cell wall biosynthesis
MTMPPRDTMRDMQEPVFIFDPTLRDRQSKVRGIGRYMQLLRENFEDSFTFTGSLSEVSKTKSSLFINPFFNLLSPPLSFMRIAKRQIAVIHDVIPLKYPNHFPVGLRGNINRLLNMLHVHQYDRIITDSQASKQDICTLLQIPEEGVKVVYPSITSQIHAQNNVKALPNIPPAYFLYVGDATWNKNLINLALAIKKADVACVFAGNVFTTAKDNLANAWQRELKEFFRLANGDARFVFSGYVSDDALTGLYKGAIANLLVSRDEGFGFSYGEAALNKCPSILADIPVLREVAQDTALFVPPEDPEQIAKLLQSFPHTPSRTTLGTKAQTRTVNLFNAERFKMQFLDAIS